MAAGVIVTIAAGFLLQGRLWPLGAWQWFVVIAVGVPYVASDYWWQHWLSWSRAARVLAVALYLIATSLMYLALPEPPVNLSDPLTAAGEDWPRINNLDVQKRTRELRTEHTAGWPESKSEQREAFVNEPLGFEPEMFIPKDAMRVYLGGTVVFTHAKEQRILEILGHPLLSVRRSEDGILLDAEVYDSEGKIVATIEDNAPRPSTESYLAERPDRHTFTVRDLENREVLRVRYVNETCIVVTGIFRYKGESLIAEKHRILLDRDGEILGSVYHGTGRRALFRLTEHGIGFGG